MSASFTRTDTHRGIRVIWVENPPVNALSPGVPEALMAAIDEANADPDVNGVVVIGAGRTFIAGADIGTLEPLAWDPDAPKPDLHDLLARVEGSTKPIVMAIHGTALGGGLELAMAAHYRVAVSSAKVGLPECALGIIPGAEGTQRLPRLAGVAKALDMVVKSKPLPAIEAHEHGILDAVLDGDLLTGAVAFAERAAAAGGPHPKTSARTDKLGTPAANAPLFEAARALARKIKPHQPAPLKAIEAIALATQLPFAEGCAAETRLFLDAVRAEPAKALLHVFFAERAAAKIPGLPAGAGAGAAPVRRVGIVGAGTMGGGIAMACTNAGLEVLLQDASRRVSIVACRRSNATTRSRSRASASRKTRSPSAWRASRRNSTWRDSRPSTS